MEIYTAYNDINVNALGFGNFFVFVRVFLEQIFEFFDLFCYILLFFEQYSKKGEYFTILDQISQITHKWNNSIFIKEIKGMIKYFFRFWKIQKKTFIFMDVPLKLDEYSLFCTAWKRRLIFQKWNSHLWVYTLKWPKSRSPTVW